MLGVSAEAIIDSSRVKERINIEILCAGTNVQVAAIWRQVGFGFIGPNGVEAFAENIFPDALPIPMGRVRIRGVYVRASFIVRQAVGWSAIRHMLKPSLFAQELVVARARLEARPDADHRLKAHLMKLPVHGRWIGPQAGDEIHL